MKAISNIQKRHENQRPRKYGYTTSYIKKTQRSPVLEIYYIFSDRRRNTIFDCDWSSDVCSSDLLAARQPAAEEGVERLDGGGKGRVAAAAGDGSDQLRAVGDLGANRRVEARAQVADFRPLPILDRKSVV